MAEVRLYVVFCLIYLACFLLFLFNFVIYIYVVVINEGIILVLYLILMSGCSRESQVLVFYF